MDSELNFESVKGLYEADREILSAEQKVIRADISYHCPSSDIPYHCAASILQH